MNTLGQHELEAVLRGLYDQCRRQPADAYMDQHSNAAYLAAHVRTFLWYRRHLPPQGRLLDWGCRHAPDSCLVRARFGDQYVIDGCDFEDGDAYGPFHEYARLRYARLSESVVLPYEDACFDAVIAAGSLEHAAFDYECLKELWRCLKVGGVLVITHLPNKWSYEEWFNRRTGRPSHQRRYGLGGLKCLLSHTGFAPLEIGYQARSGVMGSATRSGGASAVRNGLIRLSQLHRLTSCLCAVARKVDSF